MHPRIHLNILFTDYLLIVCMCVYVCACFQIEQVIEKLKSQLAEKGEELNKFREEHNIQVRGEKDTDRTNADQSSTSSSSGVLVSSTKT